MLHITEECECELSATFDIRSIRKGISIYFVKFCATLLPVIPRFSVSGTDLCRIWVDVANWRTEYTNIGNFGLRDDAKHRRGVNVDRDRGPRLFLPQRIGREAGKDCIGILKARERIFGVAGFYFRAETNAGTTDIHFIISHFRDG